jgi:hypothetical protein
MGLCSRKFHNMGFANKNPDETDVANEDCCHILFRLIDVNGHPEDSATRLALQLLLLEMSESMGNHDSEIVDAGRVD